MHGWWTFFYETGAKESEGPFEYGDKSRDWRFWHANGQLKSRGQFDGRGRKTGEWNYWDENGRQLSEVEFLDRYPDSNI